MQRRMEQICAIMRKEAEKAGVPLVIQGPATCGSFHVADKILEDSREYSNDMMLKDILLNNATA